MIIGIPWLKKRIISVIQSKDYNVECYQTQTNFAMDSLIEILGHTYQLQVLHIHINIS